MLEGATSFASARAERDCSRVILAHEPPFTIGKAEFQPATREVQFEGRTSVIEPRVMQMLVALHRAGGYVVSKDDLTATCWDGRVVGEDAINRVVSRLRAVSEKHAGGQFRVETITKVGYRLVSPVAVPAVHAKPAASDTAAPLLGRRDLIVGAGTAALATAGGFGWALLHRDPMPKQARLLVDNARKALWDGNVDGPGNAIAMLRQAVAIAPDSAEAWGLLALAYTAAAVDAKLQERPDLRARAAAAIQRAFALEPYQGDALAAQIETIPTYRNWDAHERASRAALRRHPNHPALIHGLAGVMFEVGRLEEALQLANQVQPAMPLAPDVLTSRVILLLSLGRREEADRALDSAYALLPRNSDIWSLRAGYLMFTGRAAEAVELFADKDSRPPEIDDEAYDLDLTQARAIASGDAAEIRRATQALIESAQSGNGAIIAGAHFTGFVGDADNCFRFLNAFYFNRGFRVPDIYFNRANTTLGGQRPTAFLFDWPLSRIRRDPRFAALTREIGLDDYWARTGSRPRVIA